MFIASRRVCAMLRTGMHLIGIDIPSAWAQHACALDKLDPGMPIGDAR